MQDKYKKINDYLNQYGNFFHDTFFYRNISNLYILANNYSDIVEALAIKEKSLTIHLDLAVSLTIVEDYLKTIDANYAKEFIACLKNGNIDIIDPLEYYFNVPTKAHAYFDNGLSHPDIVIPFAENYNDPKMILHEFFHYLNSPHNTDSKNTMTEIVSIYFEKRLLDYMASIGYDKKELNKIFIMRAKDTYEAALYLKKTLPFIHLYEKFGNFTATTYELHDSYPEDFIVDTEEDYDASLVRLYDSLNDIKKNPFIVAKYLFADNIVNYLRGQDINALDKKMLLLNESIDNFDIYGNLKNIAIDITDTRIMDMIMKGSFEELKKHLFLEELKRK